MSAETPTITSERPATARLFFALWPPPELAAQLAEVARVAATGLGGRPTRADTIHLTLAFLGETAVTRLPELDARARRIPGEAFAMSIDRIGYWQHNRLLWAGCSNAPEALVDLHRRLQAALAGAGFPGDPPGRSFTPHVTLLRKVAAGTARAGLDQLPVVERLAWPCDRFVLVQSEPSSSEHRYRVLGAYPLG
ncbi:RNA 2',3'-cyclic phosphodiesterase [Dechloromonas sp. XY25]|uniref:RNA 2',3'-cyclic phosphodiesterase n=1 Tax=Dechloromonas hankyongensis TaxID=2908002 RepID=A0ABS9K396_9RHOO|nr:RNA 2',3'-cyclic phosphodiesterase [Dechloromonas hankyongensis]MCG2577651.1 RNA 2',3'-cyclic phosphodiesterase [Dechloromonas hankyongensis]